MNPNLCFIFVDIPAEKQASSSWIFSLNVAAPSPHFLDFAVAVPRQGEGVSTPTPEGGSIYPVNGNAFILRVMEESSSLFEAFPDVIVRNVVWTLV